MTVVIASLVLACVVGKLSDKQNVLINAFIPIFIVKSELM